MSVNIIVREGRAMGIHLVLATQTVTPKMMKTIAFVNGRYCYQTKTDTELGELMGKEFKSRLNEVDKSTHLVFAKDWKDNGKVKKIIPAFDGDTGDDYICRSGYARKIALLMYSMLATLVLYILKTQNLVNSSKIRKN